MKTSKPIFALSIITMTLLSGCAKGEGQVAWNKVKKEIKTEYRIKAFGECQYIHTDIEKKANYELSLGLINETVAKEMKEKGNTVELFYTFTSKQNNQYYGLAEYYVTGHKVDTNVINKVSEEANASFEMIKSQFDNKFQAINSEYQSTGTVAN